MTLINTPLPHEPLLKKAQSFVQSGTVIQQGLYSFLKIEDSYIHELYELLNDRTIQKPDYFSSPTAAGAHITIAYPEENIILLKEDIATEHQFTIKNLSHVLLGIKEYFVLMVSAPSLAQLRKKYQLPQIPIYKNIPIDFHITCGVRFPVSQPPVLP